jgi:TetR/AcrR family transcriptional regulator, transcriptional repressor for nem operon
MKVSREQADANHERIIDVASRMFREKGFDGVGVAELMKAAGLTHGGFYGHFGSKDDLVAEAANRAFDRSGEHWCSIIEESKEPFSALVDRYLADSKLSKPETACMFAVLAPEAARRGRPVRKVFADGFRALTDIIAKLIPSQSKARARGTSIAIFSELVGALVLARSVDDPQLAREILQLVKSDLKARFPDPKSG